MNISIDTTQHKSTVIKLTASDQNGNITTSDSPRLTGIPV